jgi:hypothetical protein
MGQPVDVPPGRPQPVLSVPAGSVSAHPAGPLVVRVEDSSDISHVGTLPIDRLVWLEVPLRLVEAPWPPGAPLDIVVDDPAREAAGLYALVQLRRDRGVRVTIPGRPGIARCARIAMALQMPVRLVTPQPSPAVLTELDEVLDVYLHDPQASAPVEFLQSALAWWLHGDAPPIWAALELDPDWFPREDRDGASAGALAPPCEPDFVARRLARLVASGAECAGCRFQGWCQGFFKWPDPAYDCAGVTRLLARVEATAAQIGRDLDEARSLAP